VDVAGGHGELAGGERHVHRFRLAGVEVDPGEADQPLGRHHDVAAADRLVDVDRHHVGPGPAARVGHGDAGGGGEPADLEGGVGQAEAERVQRVVAGALARVGAG